jgi:phage terminase large subunit
MANKDIADVLKMQPEEVLLIPDSSEPKSNDELISYGISLVPSQKGADSVNQGIQYVQDQTVYITRRSINLLKEKENYAWKIDKKTGETINTPIDMWNHGMDAGRYGMESLEPFEKKQGQSTINNKQNDDPYGR